MMSTDLAEVMAYLAGRSVAVVGNASSLLSHAYGDFIDGHDVVVRMNRGIPIDAIAQGCSLDICCFSTIPEIGDILERASPRFAIWMSPRARRRYWGTPGVRFYALDHWQALRSRLGARPSVGALAIDLISRSAARTASILGFDFKASGTFYAAQQHLGPHDYRAESRYILGLVKERSWCFVDTRALQPGEREVG